MKYNEHFACFLFLGATIKLLLDYYSHKPTTSTVNKRVPGALQQKLMLDCTKAVEYLSSIDIVHADIRPDNIMWEPDQK